MFQHLQQCGASSCLMGTGELADLVLTFSSVFCFKYLSCGVLFILPLYEIFLVSLESLVHTCLSKLHCVCQELFFSLGILMQLLFCCLLGEKRNAQPGKANHQLICLFPVSSSGGRRHSRGSVCAGCLLCRLPVSAACAGGTGPAGSPFGGVAL